MTFHKSRIFGLVFTISTLIYAILLLKSIGSEGDTEKISAILNIKTLAILLALYSCHFISEPFRWTLYSSLSKGKTDFFTIFACFNITALLSYSLPLKLGLPIRLALLSRYLKLKSSAIIKMMGIESTLFIIFWGIYALSLIVSSPEISHLLDKKIQHQFFIGVTLIIIFSILLASIIKKRDTLQRILTEIPLLFLTTIIMSLLVDISLYGVRHIIISNALGIEIEPTIMFSIGIISIFAGIISALPMGLGAYDACLILLLKLYGIEIEIALIVALSNRLGTILASFVLGVPSAIFLWAFKRG